MMDQEYANGDTALATKGEPQSSMNTLQSIWMPPRTISVPVTKPEDRENQTGRNDAGEEDRSIIEKIQKDTGIRIIRDTESGGYVAECPDLPGCLSQGETFDEAMRNIEEAIIAYLQSLKKHGEALPNIAGIEIP